MKRLSKILSTALIAMMLCSTYAMADSTFGGNIEWMTFDNIPLGMQMPYALLWEEGEHGYTPELIQPQAASLADVSENADIIGWYIGDVTVCNAEGKVYFFFIDNSLYKVRFETVFETEDAAKAYYDKAVSELATVYGEGQENTFGLLEGEKCRHNWQTDGMSKRHSAQNENGIVPKSDNIRNYAAAVVTESETGYAVTIGISSYYDHGDNGVDGGVKYFDGRYYLFNTEVDNSPMF